MSAYTSLQSLNTILRKLYAKIEQILSGRFWENKFKIEIYFFLNSKLKILQKWKKATCQVYLTYISLAKISTKWYYWSNFKVHVIIHSQLSQNPHCPTPPPFYTVYSGFHLQQATLTDIDFPILNQFFNLRHPFSYILGLPVIIFQINTWIWSNTLWACWATDLGQYAT